MEGTREGRRQIARLSAVDVPLTANICGDARIGWRAEVAGALAVADHIRVCDRSERPLYHGVICESHASRVVLHSALPLKHVLCGK